MTGAQRAKAEEAHRAAQAKEPTAGGRIAPLAHDPERVAREAQIRTRALELAQQAFAFGIIQADAVVSTAREYETFIKGEAHG